MADRITPASRCPSCGRFVGPQGRCPYCGADVGRRMSVRIFQYGSLLLAIVGLAVLLFVARRSQVPVVDIGSLVGTMNWAYVRVEGVVSGQPTYDPEAQSLRFWVQDGTGEIMVSAYRSEAEALLAAGRVPVMGDGVAVEGTLRVREDFQYLVLNVPEHTEIRPAEPVDMAVAGVSGAPLYQRVRLRGVIREDRTPYEGLRILTLRDASGEIDVTLPLSATALGGPLPNAAVGQAVQVTGAVDQYRGSAQVSVGRGSDLLLLDETIGIAAERRIGELSADDVGSLCAVQGVIAEVNTFSAGVKYTLDDGTGTATLLLWQDLYDSLAEGEALAPGATIRAVGQVAEYRGELEIVPELPSDLEVLGAVQQPAAEWQLGQLDAGSVGRTVAVEGVLTSLRTFSAGVRGVLDDGTGTVTLLLWQDVYDALDDPARLAAGTVLRVEGEVAEYRGELEVVPRAAGDVAVVGSVELPAEERAIGQIGADDVGQTVQVAARIGQVTLFSAGVKYTLEDGTGTITLLVWQDLYEQLTDAAGLAEGSWVSVRGEIDEYQGELEIVPQVPADVAVTHSGPIAQTTATPAPGLPPAPGASAEPTVTTVPTATVPTATATPPPAPKPTRQPTPAVETRAIGAIGAGDVGRTLQVARAGIADVQYFSRGVRYTLSDASGSIVLLLWQDVLEEIPERYDLFAGSQVRVSGEIDEYQGTLEIVPRAGADVTVLERGERAPVEERGTGAVTAADEGRIFVVSGTVARTESNGWLKLWLDDGSGELLVFVPERAVAYLPAGIGPGAGLRLRGEVDVYQGEIEIIPLAGADVEVQ